MELQILIGALKTCLPPLFLLKIQKLNAHISDFNKYLSFDKWKVVRNHAEISFEKLDKVEFTTPKKRMTKKAFFAKSLMI
jgi:hypothetical protein